MGRMNPYPTRPRSVGHEWYDETWVITTLKESVCISITQCSASDSTWQGKKLNLQCNKMFCSLGLLNKPRIIKQIDWRTMREGRSRRNGVMSECINVLCRHHGRWADSRISWKFAHGRNGSEFSSCRDNRLKIVWGITHHTTTSIKWNHYLTHAPLIPRSSVQRGARCLIRRWRKDAIVPDQRQLSETLGWRLVICSFIF